MKWARVPYAAWEIVSMRGGPRQERQEEYGGRAHVFPQSIAQTPVTKNVRTHICEGRGEGGGVSGAIARAAPVQNRPCLGPLERLT